MKLTADYHTHTTFSHGKGSVLNNAEQAQSSLLKEIGITDHGFSHVVFSVRRREIPKLISECREAEARTGVKVYTGLENNIRGVSGRCDLTQRDYEYFDLFLAGIHLLVYYDKCTDSKIGLGSWLRQKMKIKPSASLVKATTRAYINAVEKNPIDILTHVGYKCFCDPVEVAKCCRDHGTYMEISSKKRHLTDDELCACAATGVKFLINSDAHDVSRVGDTRLAAEQIFRTGIPLEQIENIDGRLPVFRFSEYKRTHC